MTPIENIKNRIETLRDEIDNLDGYFQYHQNQVKFLENQINIKNSIKNELEKILKDFETQNKYVELWRVGNKIEAIKQYRQDTGASLKEAKDACERMAVKAGLPPLYTYYS